jgi:hypothetical protein
VQVKRLSATLSIVDTWWPKRNRGHTVHPHLPGAGRETGSTTLLPEVKPCCTQKLGRTGGRHLEVPACFWFQAWPSTIRSVYGGGTRRGSRRPYFEPYREEHFRVGRDGTRGRATTGSRAS